MAPERKGREPPIMIVLDANILIRAVLGQRVGHLLEAYSASGMQFHAPHSCFAEAAEYLPSLLKRKGRTDIDPNSSLEFLSRLVFPVELESFASFEGEARQRLRGRDEDDWPVLAAALALNCPIWSEDADFFGTGIAVWTTSRIEIFLKKQRNIPASSEDD